MSTGKRQILLDKRQHAENNVYPTQVNRQKTKVIRKRQQAKNNVCQTHVNRQRTKVIRQMSAGREECLANTCQQS